MRHHSNILHGDEEIVGEVKYHTQSHILITGWPKFGSRYLTSKPRAYGLLPTTHRGDFVMGFMCYTKESGFNSLIV